MTIEESLPKKNILTPYDIAPILGVSPEEIASQAERDVSQLGFPVCNAMGEIVIPKAGFLNWYYNVQYWHLNESLLHHINNSN